MRAAAGICFVAALGLACETSPRTVTASPPLRDVKVYGGNEAIADLTEGVSARSVVGNTLFADFEPDWTQETAEAHFGKPSEVTKRGDDVTLFIYERQGKRIAVVRQAVIPTDGGPKTTSFHLEALPQKGFEDTLPQSLREVIRSNPSLRQIHFRSTAPGDWNIHLHLQDGRVSYVSATTLPPGHEQG
jgi:hypothetical protein